MRFKTVFIFTLTILLSTIIYAVLPPIPSQAGSPSPMRQETSTPAAAPTGAPTGAPTSAPEETQTAKRATHTVRAGETLISIAIRYGVSLEALMEANKLTSADFLRIGQELVIPQEPTPTPTPQGRRTHLIRPGETLTTIALRYGVSVNALMEANSLTNSDFLSTGQELIIPDEPTATPGPTATPTPQGQRIHRVQSGESLISIALRYDAPLTDLMRVNGLDNFDIIRVGQELIIPDKSTATPTGTPTPQGRRTHRVQAGETLIAVAIRYDVTVDALMEANNLLEPGLIRIGQELIIPNKKSSTPAPQSPAFTSHRENSLYLCQANAAVFSPDLPADPIQAAISDGRLYLLADGDLFGIDLDALDEARKEGGNETPSVENLTPPDRKVDRYTIRELVYLTVEPESGDLLLLDKSNDIYRYRPAGDAGTWRMEFAAAPIPGQYPDPQYLALQSVDGDLYVLDADLSRVWRFSPGDTLPKIYMSTGRLNTAMDMAFPPAGAEEETLVALTRSGHLLKFIHGRPVLGFGEEADLGDDGWPAQVFALGNSIVVADGQSRSLLGIDLDNGRVTWTVGLRFPDMQRLRGAAIDQGMLYALAGPSLYVADLNQDGRDEQGDIACPPVTYDDAYYFDGQDVQALMPDYGLPFPGAKLPPRPRSYPGARRLYRYGMHEGVDLYSSDVAGLGIGSHVLAIADGTVTRADTDYVEMTPVEFEAVMRRTEEEHRTPPDLTEKLRGQQVHIQHDNGVQSWYAHLSGIPDDVVPGEPMKQGNVVGYVGVSGTSSGAYGLSDGAHLHFEVWINGRYLGQGLSLYETMRLWRAVFEP